MVPVGTRSGTGDASRRHRAAMPRRYRRRRPPAASDDDQREAPPAPRSTPHRWPPARRTPSTSSARSAPSTSTSIRRRPAVCVMPGCGQVDALGEAAAHRAALAHGAARTPAPRPAVAGMAPGHDVVARAGTDRWRRRRSVAGPSWTARPSTTTAQAAGCCDQRSSVGRGAEDDHVHRERARDRRHSTAQRVAPAALVRPGSRTASGRRPGSADQRARGRTSAPGRNVDAARPGCRRTAAAQRRRRRRRPCQRRPVPRPALPGLALLDHGSIGLDAHRRATLDAATTPRRHGVGRLAGRARRLRDRARRRRPGGAGRCTASRGGRSRRRSSRRRRARRRACRPRAQSCTYGVKPGIGQRGSRGGRRRPRWRGGRAAMRSIARARLRDRLRRPARRRHRDAGRRARGARR